MDTPPTHRSAKGEAQRGAGSTRNALETVAASIRGDVRLGVQNRS